MVMSESFCRVLFARRKIGVSQRRFTLQRGSSFLYEFAVSIRESNHLVNFLLKGGEQGEDSIVGKKTEKRFTLMELAKKSGIGKSTLNNIENGKVSPTLFQLEMIAIAMGVKITDLFESEYK